MSPLFPDIECIISQIQQVCGVHLEHKQTLLVCRLLVQTSGSRCVSASATKYIIFMLYNTILVPQFGGEKTATLKVESLK